MMLHARGKMWKNWVASLRNCLQLIICWHIEVRPITWLNKVTKTATAWPLHQHHGQHFIRSWNVNKHAWLVMATCTHPNVQCWTRKKMEFKMAGQLKANNLSSFLNITGSRTKLSKLLLIQTFYFKVEVYLSTTLIFWNLVYLPLWNNVYGSFLWLRVVYLTYISSKYPSLALLSQFTRDLSVYIYSPTNHSSPSNSCRLL